MTANYCYNCMNKLSGATKICPKCGFDNSSYVQPDEALPCGTVLNNRYLIGRMIGQGGFGLTYIGYDQTLGTPVCIKEYFPAGGAMRGQDGSTRVYWSAGSTGAALKQGRKTFLEEAQKAAQVRSLASIVNVWDAFNENDTAYIVMEYIKGVTLKDYLKKRGTVMDTEECLGFLLPVIRDLKEVHENEIVHRDISPDNLIIDEKGKVMLLDLGAAKDLSKGSEQSSMLVHKKGFSPPEQYIEGKIIGSWTDVYAMCATIYYCMTGKMLPDVMDRVRDETLEYPEIMPESMKAVLEHGLKVELQERIKDMGELEKELEAALEVIRNPGKSEEEEKTQENQKQPGEGPKEPSENPEQPGVNPSEPSENRKQVGKNSDKPEENLTQTAEGPKKSWLKVILALAAVAILIIAALIRWQNSRSKDTPAEETAASENTGNIQEDEQFETSAEGMTDEQNESETEEQVATEGETSVITDKEEQEESQPTSESVAVLSTLSKDKFTKWADRTVDTVVFQNTLYGAPTDAEDLSEKGDRSVLGWKEGEKLYIAGEGGVRAPEDCSYLFSVKDAYSHKSQRWNKLTTIINANYLDMSKVTNMEYMFYYCESLYEMNLDKWVMSSVTNMAGMFSKCSSLSILNIGSWNTGRVNKTQLMFIDCSSLTNINVSGWVMSNVTDMNAMFFNCSGITELDLSGWDTSSVRDMSEMFYHCDGLTSLDVSDWVTSKVTDMQGLFEGCSNLASLDVSSWDTSKVTDMSDLFADCSNLASLDIGSWDTSKVKYMPSMFYGCYSLTSLDISNWDTSSLENSNNAFTGTKWENDPPF